MKNVNEIPLILKILQFKKWKIYVPLFWCSFAQAQQPDLFNHTPTSFSAVILGQVTIEGVSVEEGDWVGVFDDSGNCAGATAVELINNKLKIFPIPTADIKLWFEYIIKKDRSNPLKTPAGRASDYSNAPYTNMKYTDINDVGKQWIRKYT